MASRPVGGGPVPMSTSDQQAITRGMTKTRLVRIYAMRCLTLYTVFQSDLIRQLNSALDSVDMARVNPAGRMLVSRTCTQPYTAPGKRLLSLSLLE